MWTRFRRRRGLIVLNAVLLAVLAALTWSPLASGQNQGAGRARGDYTMVAGKTTAGGPAAVYLIDSANQEVVALRWDQSKQEMVGLGYRSLQTDARQVPGR